MNAEGSSLNDQESDAGPGYGSSSSQSKKPTKSKKRASRAGQRFVSSLSDAQLERKRANDREAQRAIRMRTQETIRGLQQSNEELRSNADVSARRIAELEYENAYLRDTRPILRLPPANVNGPGSQLSQPGPQGESYPASPCSSSGHHVDSTTSRRPSLTASHSSSVSGQGSWHQTLPQSGGLGSAGPTGRPNWQQHDGYGPDVPQYQEPTAAMETRSAYEIAQNEWSNAHSPYFQNFRHQGHPDWPPIQSQHQLSPYASRDQPVYDGAGPTYQRPYQPPPLQLQGGDLHGSRGEYRHHLSTHPQMQQAQQGQAGFQQPPQPTAVASMSLPGAAFSASPAGPPYSYQQPPRGVAYRDQPDGQPPSHPPI